MKQSNFIWLLIPLLFSGCTSIRVYKNKEFDKTPSSIAVAAGAGVLGVQFKELFKSYGFKIISTEGGTQTEKVSDNKTITVSKNKYKYVLNVTSVREDSCFPTGGAMLNFELNLVNVDSGEEIISMSGRDCEQSIVRRFRKEIGF